MYHDHGVSTMLVMGGSGDYCEVADCVIALKEFQTEDVIEQAREGGQQFGVISKRQIDHQSMNPEKGKKSVSMKVNMTENLLYGDEKIDVSQLEQFTGQGKLKAMGEAMVYLFHNANGKAALTEDLRHCDQLLDEKGLDALSPKLRGDLVRFRKVELAPTKNRYRNLKTANV